MTMVAPFCMPGSILSPQTSQVIGETGDKQKEKGPIGRSAVLPKGHPTGGGPKPKQVGQDCESFRSTGGCRLGPWRRRAAASPGDLPGHARGRQWVAFIQKHAARGDGIDGETEADLAV